MVTTLPKSIFPSSFSHSSTQWTATTEAINISWSPVRTQSTTLHSAEIGQSVRMGSFTFVPSVHFRFSAANLSSSRPEWLPR